jgi:hypothetical protein
MKTCRTIILGLILFFSFTFFTVGISQAQAVPDLSIWADTWFKVKLAVTVYHYSDIGVKPTPNYQITPLPDPAYLHIVDWVEGAQTLQTVIYYKDPTGNWNPAVSVPADMIYFAGSDLKFVCSSTVDTGTMQNGLIIFFKGKRDIGGNFILGGKTNMKSLGGYYFESDNVPGSTERWAGSAVVSGKMVPLSKVPSVLLAP